MSLPVITPNFIFGLSTEIKGNVHYLKDNEVLYPVGAVVAVHDFQTNRQKYIKLLDKRRPISVLCLSHNKKLLAVAEKGDPPSVSIYDVASLNRIKVWVVSRSESPSAVEFASIAFSRDSKLLAGITGHPDWLLLCYSIEKNKVESSGKAQNPVHPGPILQVTFSPEDSTMICIGGPGCLRFLQYAETMWNQVGFSKSEFLQITTFCWLSQYKVLAGTRDGRIIVLEDGDLRAIHVAKDLVYLNIRERVQAPEHSESSTLEEAIQAAHEPFGSKPGRMELNSMICFVKGFAFSYGFGFVYVYWRESDTRYRRSHIFKVPTYVESVDVPIEDRIEPEVVAKDSIESVLSSQEVAAPSEKSLISTSSDLMELASLGNASIGSGALAVEEMSASRKSSAGLSTSALDAVRQICINIAETELIATSGRSQLYYTQLWVGEENQEPVFLQNMGENLHHGPISGLAVCMLKPIFATCGAYDKTVRLWNYETASLELVKNFEDDLFCIDLHPTGLHVILGFSDKLRFMNVLIDDLKQIRELAVRKCNECAFSYSGHLFAATNSSNINIYSTLTFEQLYSFKGHKKRIVSLSWSRSDYQLVSCGIFGNVYEWDLPSRKRTAETVSYTKPFTHAVISSGATSTYASGLDGRLCELAESKVMQTFSWEDKKLNMVMLSHSDKMIFVTDSHGTLITLCLPLTTNNEWASLNMHNELIVKMKISFNDHYIITASEDGSICIWKVDASMVTGMIKLSADIVESKDILIGKEDLQNKVELIQELSARVSHLELEHAFKMKQAQDQHSEKLQEIQDSYYKELEDIKNVNEEMESKHAQEISVLNENVEKLKLGFETRVHNMEMEFNDKLIREYEKYEKLEDLHKLLKNECEMKYAELLKDKEMALQGMTDDYEEKLNQKILEIAELHKQAICRAKEHEEIKSQIEDDVDREMVELKTKYERLLKEEHDTNMRLRGEVAAMKKRLLSSQKEIDEFLNQVQALQAEQLKYKQAIQGLEKDIADLKKEIQERDTSVHLKETRIFELKRKNQELEKFKYVLNFKITELKNQKEPREREIKERKEQIQDMERELGILQNRNEIFELKMKYYNEKLSGMETELKNQRIHAQTLNTYCQRMQCDIYHASGFIQNPKKLKELVKQLNMKYNKDKTIIKAKEEDDGASIEFQRQREHLERTIATLRSQLQKETERSKRDHFHLVGENSALITEMNKMQFELKAALKHIQEIETVVGLTGKSESINEAQMKFKAALMTNEEIHESYAKKIEHLEQIIEIQKGEVDRLSSKLSHFEQITAKPGTSPSGS